MNWIYKLAMQNIFIKVVFILWCCFSIILIFYFSAVSKMKRFFTSNIVFYYKYDIILIN